MVTFRVSSSWKWFHDNAVVHILTVICAQSRRISAMESRRKKLHTGVSLTSSAPPIRRKHNSARLIIAMVVFFLACHLVKDYLILRTVFVSDMPDNLALVVTVLLVANSAANPLVYAFLKRDIKREVERLTYRRGNMKHNCEQSW